MRGQQSFSRSRRVGVHMLALAPLAWVMLCWLLAPRPAAAQEAAAPAECKVGAFVIAIHSLDFARGTFAVEMWMWSVCPTGVASPLETMDFINADAVTASHVSAGERNGTVWSSRKVTATVRQRWDLTDYPFDRQTLQIQMEEASADASSFAYEPDNENSAVHSGIAIKGWKIVSFSLEPSMTTYDTTYGDPAAEAGGSSRYGRLTLKVGIERTEVASFFTLTVVVYAAFLFALSSYFVHLEGLHIVSPQMGLLAAALFAAAINMGRANASLSSASGLTLVDKIHFIVFGYIIATGVVVVVSRLLVDRGWDQAAVARLNYRAAAIAAVTFVAANALLIGMAVTA